MKKYIFIIYLISINLYSQGFDWQISRRYPIEMPKKFFGVGLDYSIGLEIGDFNLIENLIQCCRFTDGNSNSISFNLYNENWMNDGNSYILLAKINFFDSNFEINNKEVIRDGFFETKYIFNNKLIRVAIGGAYKYKIEDIGLYLLGGLEINLNISNKEEFKERAISNNVPFDERVLFDGNIDKFNNLLFIPFIEIGKDLELGYGIYASPGIKLNYTLNSLLENENWRSIFFSINLKVFKTF